MALECLKIRKYIVASMTKQEIQAFDDMEGFIERDPHKEDLNVLLDTHSKYVLWRMPLLVNLFI